MITGQAFDTDDVVAVSMSIVCLLQLQALRKAS